MNQPNDPIWTTIVEEVEQAARSEVMLASFLHATILNHERFEDALSFHLASKLGSATIHTMTLREVIYQALNADPAIGEAARADIHAVRDRDPACRYYSTPLLYFKGYSALQAHRIAHWLWHRGRVQLALYLQSRVSEIFAVDIHPAARIGKGIMLDHATGIVIGETAAIDDNVSMLHGVTLGGTGKERGDRHPKIRQGCLIGVGAKVLGNIVVGEGSIVGDGSVVLHPVPPHSRVVGVPARVIGRTHGEDPALVMDQFVDRDPNDPENGAQ